LQILFGGENPLAELAAKLPRFMLSHLVLEKNFALLESGAAFATFV
jgi:hypothetical protein